MPYREYMCIRSTSISMRFTVVGHDFNVNETTICIKYSVFKQKHTENKVIYGLVGEDVVSRGSKTPNPAFPLVIV